MAGLFWNSGSPYRALPRQTPSLRSEGQKRSHCPRTQTVFLVTKARAGSSASLRGLAPAGLPGSHGGPQPERQPSGDKGVSRRAVLCPPAAPQQRVPTQPGLPHPLRDLGGGSRPVLCHALLAGISPWPQTEDAGGRQKPDEAGRVLLQSLRGEGGPVNTLISDPGPRTARGYISAVFSPQRGRQSDSQRHRPPEPTALPAPSSRWGRPRTSRGPQTAPAPLRVVLRRVPGWRGHSAPAPGSSLTSLPGFCSQDEFQLRGHETVFPVRSGSA